MKISISQMFRIFNKSSITKVVAVVFLGTLSLNAQGEASSVDGEKLFSAKCATCHHPVKDGTGPKLQGVRTAWEEGGAAPEAIYTWVRNWNNAAATDAYAKTIVNKKPSAMSTFPELTDAEIDAMLDWADAYVEPVKEVASAGANAVVEEEAPVAWTWVMIVGLFVVLQLALILGLRSNRRELEVAAGTKPDDYAETTSGQRFRAWAFKNLRYSLLVSLVVFIALLVMLFQTLYQINVVENYQPSQPIDFPHSVHAGVNGIDCKYCHNSAAKSKSAGFPTVNVCMNCHKQVTGETDEQKTKIAKIYEAAGWDAEKGVYTGKTKPIVWNKVHVLPDHVYFNHSQHVEVGGVDCKQCHGDMATMEETAKVQPVSVLNAIEGNVKLTRQTLTMGWCIECHGEKEVSNGPIADSKGGYYAEIHQRLMNGDKELYEKYLEDGKVTVKELGGWECGKCHY